jgi:hypothetical protein
LFRCDKISLFPSIEKDPNKQDSERQLLISYSIMEGQASVPGSDSFIGMKFSEFIPRSAALAWKIKQFAVAFAGRGVKGSTLEDELVVGKVACVLIQDHTYDGKTTSRPNGYEVATNWEKKKGQPLSSVDVNLDEPKPSTKSTSIEVDI